MILSQAPTSSKVVRAPCPPARPVLPPTGVFRAGQIVADVTGCRDWINGLALQCFCASECDSPPMPPPPPTAPVSCGELRDDGQPCGPVSRTNASTHAHLEPPGPRRAPARRTMTMRCVGTAARNRATAGATMATASGAVQATNGSFRSSCLTREARGAGCTSNSRRGTSTAWSTL